MIHTILRAFGTLNTLTVYDNDKKNAALYEAEKLIKDMNNRWSVFCDNSEISLINRMAGKDYFTVCSDTYDIIEQSVLYSQLTHGVFDITMQPLIERLVFHNNTVAPPDDEIQRLLTLVNYRDILLCKAGSKVMLKHPEQKLSLGAIAKGYAVQKISALLKQNGVANAVINLGGTICVIGKERSVGLQHPLKKRGQIMGELIIKDKIIVTSGAYEQEHIKNGIRYHHILDPNTGKFSQSDLLSVTLIGDNGAMLDALATAIFILGLERGYGLVKNLGLEAVFVTNDLKILATEGLKEILKIAL